MSTPEKFISANGLNIHYVDDGGYGRPLILLHGGSATLDSWHDHLDCFTPHFRVITPDTRGHGKTIHPGGDFTYPVMAADVAAFIRALKLDKPLIFGYSDGGQIALEVGIRYPGLAGALVLGGTQYKFSPVYFDALREIGFPSPGAVDFEYIQQHAPGWVEFLKVAHPRDGEPDYWKTLMHQLSTLWWTPVGYTAADFAKMTEPTLVIIGDRDGIEVEETVELYRMIPQAELAILPNADHETALNQTFMTLVRDFLLRQGDGD